MPTFLLLLLGLTAGCVRTQDSSEGIPAAVASPLKKGTGGLGDLCEDQCGPGTHTTCDNKTCKCDRYHPVVIDNRYCVKPVLLGKPCIHHDQCQYHEEHALCREYSINYTECQCRDNYEVRVIQGLAIPKLCVPGTYTGLIPWTHSGSSSYNAFQGLLGYLSPRADTSFWPRFYQKHMLPLPWLLMHPPAAVQQEAETTLCAPQPNLRLLPGDPRIALCKPCAQEAPDGLLRPQWHQALGTFAKVVFIITYI
ncbi:hypothetical protein OTU49_006761 [Cherax quadricarinatus]|uniref:Uncharacterized protein n=1 Tax=Cherax quadricarinatus TaxID=27406 RepID=A0AAW0WLN5_CHEQU